MAVCHVAKEVVCLKDLLGELGTGLAVTFDRFRRQPGRSRAHAKPRFPPTLKTHRDSVSLYSKARSNGTAHRKVYPDKNYGRRRTHKVAPPS